jgi:hypothetical protein
MSNTGEVKIMADILGKQSLNEGGSDGGCFSVISVVWGAEERLAFQKALDEDAGGWCVSVISLVHGAAERQAPSE